MKSFKTLAAALVVAAAAIAAPAHAEKAPASNPMAGIAKWHQKDSATDTLPSAPVDEHKPS